MRGEINNAAGVGATDLEVDGLGVEALLHLERLEVDLFRSRAEVWASAGVQSGDGLLSRGAPKDDEFGSDAGQSSEGHGAGSTGEGRGRGLRAREGGR